MGQSIYRRYVTGSGTCAKTALKFDRNGARFWRKRHSHSNVTFSRLAPFDRSPPHSMRSSHGRREIRIVKTIGATIPIHVAARYYSTTRVICKNTIHHIAIAPCSSLSSLHDDDVSRYMRRCQTARERAGMISEKDRFSLSLSVCAD